MGVALSVRQKGPREPLQLSKMRERIVTVSWANIARGVRSCEF
jgi:hypothetical protein